MAIEVRRIVTGHDANGKAVIKTDERLPAGWAGRTSPAVRSGRRIGCRPTTRRRARPLSAKGSLPGTIMSARGRARLFGSPNSPPAHPNSCTVPRPSITPCCCRASATSSSTAARWRTWGPGDVVVQRGTMHAWVNNGPAPSVFAFILIDANPASVAGQELRTHFPAP